MPLQGGTPPSGPSVWRSRAGEAALEASGTRWGPWQGQGVGGYHLLLSLEHLQTFGEELAGPSPC